MRNSRPKQAFICQDCGKPVPSPESGTRQRSHCPYCLSSLHLDDAPGDRSADCAGLMEPIGVWVRRDGEWALLHRCRRCGTIHSNRIAGDDDPVKLLSLAVKPLASPPFPLERLTEMLGRAEIGTGPAFRLALFLIVWKIG